LIAQPTAFPVGPGLMAAVVLSPYGGAGPDEIGRFPSYTGLTPLTGEAPVTSPWHFWRDQGAAVTLAFDEPGQAGAVHVVMELAPGQVPALWWGLARQRAQLTVVWLPQARHPTTEEIATALGRRTGWMASARRVPPVALL
jgi:hypothetical protein